MYHSISNTARAASSRYFQASWRLVSQAAEPGMSSNSVSHHFLRSNVAFVGVKQVDGETLADLIAALFAHLVHAGLLGLTVDKRIARSARYGQFLARGRADGDFFDGLAGAQRHGLAGLHKRFGRLPASNRRDN